MAGETGKGHGGGTRLEEEGGTSRVRGQARAEGSLDAAPASRQPWSGQRRWEGGPHTRGPGSVSSGPAPPSSRP